MLESSFKQGGVSFLNHFALFFIYLEKVYIYILHEIFKFLINNVMFFKHFSS